jgi:hypothetical protein
MTKPISFDEGFTGMVHGEPPRVAQNRIGAWESFIGGCAAYDHLDFTLLPTVQPVRGEVSAHLIWRGDGSMDGPFAPNLRRVLAALHFGLELRAALRQLSNGSTFKVTRGHVRTPRGG